MRAVGVLVALVLIAAAAVHSAPLRLQQRHHRTRTTATALSALALGARDGYDDIASDIYAVVVAKFKALAAAPPAGVPPHNTGVDCVQDSANNPLCTAQIVRKTVGKFMAAANQLRVDLLPQCHHVEALECQLKAGATRWQANFFCMSGPTPADIKWNVHLDCVDSVANGGAAKMHVDAEKKKREDAKQAKLVAAGKPKIDAEMKKRLDEFEKLVQVTPEEKKAFEDSLAADAALQAADKAQAEARAAIQKKLDVEAAKTTGPGKKKYDPKLFPKGSGHVRTYDPFNPTSSGSDVPARDAAIIEGAFPTEVAAFKKVYGEEKKKDDGVEKKEEPKKKADSAPASGSAPAAAQSMGQRFSAWMCSWGSCSGGGWIPLPDLSSCSPYGCIRCLSRAAGCPVRFLQHASAWCCGKAKGA